VNFSGVQCGRATWNDGVAVFVKHGVTALEDWLHDEGARNIENVNKHLRAALLDERRIALGKALTVNDSHAR
jgi:tagatose-1,6-bisphosphate aldolase